MKLSAQEEYGLRCLLQLAKAERNGESLTLSQIASQEGISSANAGKLMWILTKAGLVQSTRGIKGGYVLAMPATDIRLNQVIRVLEGEPAESHCKSYAGVLDVCVHTGDCGIRRTAACSPANCATTRRSGRVGRDDAAGTTSCCSRGAVSMNAARATWPSASRRTC